MTPEVRVLRGAPDDDELAALVAGLAAGTVVRLDGGPTSDPPEAARRAVAARRRWRDALRSLDAPPAQGPDAWRWSGRR